MSVTNKPPQSVSLAAGVVIHNVGAPTELETGSVNGDGVVDIIVYDTEGDQTVSVLKGHGNGVFDAPQYATLAPNEAAEFFAIGNIDSDTKLDIAVQEHKSGDQVTVVELGLGGGAFGAPMSFDHTDNSVGPIIVADINGDGYQDIVRVNGDSKGRELQLTFGNGDGTFGPIQGIYDFTPGEVHFLVAADFNGDGRMDLALSGFPSYVLVLEQDANGAFQAVPTVPTGSFPNAVAAADINGDGRADLVIGYGSTIAVALGNIDGTFQTPIVTATSGNTTPGIAVVDMNGDGYLDVVLMAQSGSGVDILLGKGDGSFIDQGIVGTASGNSITAGDFNGDGKQDLAVGDHDGGTVSIFLNTTVRITTITKHAADGSTYVYTYSDGHLTDLLHTDIPDPHYVKQDTVYAMDGTRTSSVRTDSNGDTVSTFTLDPNNGDKTFVNNELSYRSVIHTDGTQDFYYTNVQNELWTEDHRHYNMNGVLDQDTRTFNTTATVYNYERDALTGAETTDKYDRSGVQTFHELSDNNGTDTTLYTNGDATNETIVHLADNTKDVYVYDVQGKSYTEDHRHYDANGVLDEQTRTHTNGSDDYTYDRNAATGVETTDRYDSSGVRTSHAVVDVNANTSDTFTYTNSVLVREVQIHGDQNKDIFLSNVTGKAFTAEHDSYDANGVQLSTDQTLLDGSHSQKALAAGVTLISTGVADAMKSAAAGDDTFQFGPTFGHDTVNGFHAGEGANHDVLDFSHSPIQSGDLTVAASGQHDTLITLDPNDSILLKGVLVNTLTDHDFLFGGAAVAA